MTINITNYTGSRILIDGPVIVDQDLIIPSGKTLEIMSGGRLIVASGKVVTIYGPIIAGPYQIFDAESGGIVFGANSISDAYAEWWGIDGINDEVEFNKAIASLPHGGTIQCLPGTYNIQAAPIVVSSAITIRGASEAGITQVGGIDYGTVFHTTLTNSGAFRIVAGTYHPSFIGFSIRGGVSTETPVTGRHGIEARTTTATDAGKNILGVLIEHIRCFQLDVAFKAWDTTAGTGVDIQISGFLIKHCNTNECNGAVYFSTANGELHISEQSYFIVMKTAIDIVKAGIVNLHSVHGAAPDGYGGDIEDSIFIKYGFAKLTMIGCQAEQIETWFTDEDAPTQYADSVVLIGCVVDRPCYSTEGISIISIGNYYDGGDFELESVKLVSINDTFLSPYKFNYNPALNNVTIIGAGAIGQGSSSSSVGFEILPSGTILQWGQGAATQDIVAGASVDFTVTFPLEFPTATWRASVNPVHNSSLPLLAVIKSATTTGMVLRVHNLHGSTAASAVDINWFVNGN